MNKLKRTLAIFIIAIMTESVAAQHFYHRLDISTANLYAFVASNLATAGLNTLTNDKLFDNEYSYCFHDIKVDMGDIKAKRYDITGLTARDFFNDVKFGCKLGYKSFLPEFVNWGVFASAHYKINQFKTQMGEDTEKHNIQKALLGGGALLTLGDISSKVKVLLEAGVRYEMPLSYKGALGDKAEDILNSGVSSHFSVRFGGTSWLDGIGIYADIPHYNQLKENTGIKLRNYQVGIVYTITPGKVKEAY